MFSTNVANYLEVLRLERLSYRRYGILCSEINARPKRTNYNISLDRHARSEIGCCYMPDSGFQSGIYNAEGHVSSCLGALVIQHTISSALTFALLTDMEVLRLDRDGSLRMHYGKYSPRYSR